MPANNETSMKRNPLASSENERPSANGSVSTASKRLARVTAEPWHESTVLVTVHHPDRDQLAAQLTHSDVQRLIEALQVASIGRPIRDAAGNKGKRLAVRHAYNGEELTMKEWAARCRMRPSNLCYQVRRVGLEAALERFLPKE